MENQVRRLVLVFTLMEYTALFPKRNIRPVTYHSAKKTLIGSRDCIYKCAYGVQWLVRR